MLLTNSPNYTHRPSLFHIFYFGIALVLVHISRTNAVCTPGVDCWAKNLIVPINNNRFTNDQMILTIENMMCSNVTIPTLSSSIPSSSLSDLLVRTDYIGMNCIGNWQLKSPNETESGTIGAVVSGLSVALNISLGSEGIFVTAMPTTIDVQISSITIQYNNASDASILSMFQSDVESNITFEIQNFTDSQVQNAVSSQIDVILSGANNYVNTLITSPYPVLPPTAFTAAGGSVDLTTNPIVGLMDYVLNDVLGPNGSIGVNKIVNFLTDNTGTVSLNIDSLFNLSIFQKYNISAPKISYDLQFAEMTLSPLWINVSGLNTWGPSNFAVPVSNQTLDTSTLIDNLGLTIEFGVNLTFLEPAAEGGALYQTSVMHVNLMQAELINEIDIVLSKLFLGFLRPNELLSPGCLANTIQFMQINYLNLSFNMENIAVKPANAQLETSGVQLINNALATFIGLYSNSLSDIINDRIYSDVSPINLQSINYLLPQVMNMTSLMFPCNPTFNSSTYDKIVTVSAFMAALGVCLLAILVSKLIMRFNEGNENTYLAGSPSSDYENLPLLPRTSRIDALMINPSIPALIRYGVLLAILANTAMFVVSNASVGASVYLVVHTGDELTQFPSLFDFSLVNSVRDMWNAKVYALSILIGLFSGFWPYAKLLLLLICWVVPVHRLNLQRRGRILIMLDAMGKWSLIDSFVLILMMVAFHFTLAPPITPQTPAGMIMFEAYVQPHFGFYSFLIATMLSLVLTHFVIKVHDFSLESSTHAHYLNDSKEALWSHATAGGPLRAAYLLTLVTVLIATSSVLLGFGINIHSFNFSFSGAFGLLLKFIGQPETLSFSVLSLGQSFPSSSLSPDSFGIRFIQVSFFLFAVAMPIGYLVCLIVLWMVPMTYKIQSRLLTMTATIHAWSALEVFVISIMAALLELQQFAQFIIGSRCDMINKILASFGSELLHGDNKCFDVVATLETGCWVLFAACLIYVMVGSLVVRGCHVALKSRSGRPLGVN